MNLSSWPQNCANIFAVSKTQTADIVLEYVMFKNSDGAVLGNKLKRVIVLLNVLPVSSADCERGFSQVNLYHSSRRIRLIITSEMTS